MPQNKPLVNIAIRLMRFVGLLGEAALAVVTGMFLNFYAAIGIIIALGLTAWL